MEEFKERIKKALQEVLGDSYEIAETEVTKLNDSKHPTLVVREKESLVGATVYLDNYYKEESDEPIISIANRIVDTINRSEKPKIDSDFTEKMTNFDSVKDKIIFKLVSKDMNKEYLKDKVYVDYIDLAIIFCVLINNSHSSHATAVVSKRLFDKWNVDKEELYDIAKENTIRLFPPEIKSLDSIIKKYISANNAEELDDYYLPETVNNLYVLTNKEKLNGATIILYENLLSEFAKEIGVKELIILPSSIHETLILPCIHEEMIDNRFYRQLVKEVNDTEVSREEILSYSVYKYSSKDNRVSILD